MLTTGQLARMRADANRLLDKTATIFRRTLIDDGRGGQRADYSTKVGEDVACRLSATSVRGRARDAVKGEKIEAAEGWIVSLPVGTDVEETDRLEIDDVTYEIVSSLAGRSFEVNIRLIVKKV
jgi:hypothetical protein